MADYKGSSSPCESIGAVPVLRGEGMGGETHHRLSCLESRLTAVKGVMAWRAGEQVMGLGTFFAVFGRSDRARHSLHFDLGVEFSMGQYEHGR